MAESKDGPLKIQATGRDPARFERSDGERPVVQYHHGPGGHDPCWNRIAPSAMQSDGDVRSALTGHRQHPSDRPPYTGD